ncbi:MAG: type II toxin-antitoxin system RelE/ParE family toxin [Dehalococcoidia bacterium]
MQIIWRDRARADLRGLYVYLLDRNPAAALRTEATITSRIQTLVDQPNLGRPGRTAGTRELVIPRTPYVVGYAVDVQADAVIVLRVLHGARSWPDALP